jgi:hypothetical protein
MLARTGGVISRNISVALFRLDVLVEVSTLTSTKLIHQSSARITILRDVLFSLPPPRARLSL